MDMLHLILFLITGLAVGWGYGTYMKGKGFGTLGNLIVGIIGAFIGGHLLGILGITTFGLIGTLIMAILGAFILLFLVGLVKK